MSQYTQDYSMAKQRHDMLQAMMVKNRQPTKHANIGTALGKILERYFLHKSSKSAAADMKGAVQGQEFASATDMANIMGAYRGDTPENEILSQYPDGTPAHGMMNRGTGQDVNAMAQAMMGARDPATQKLGMSSLLGMGKANQPTARMREYNFRDALQKSGASDADIMAFDRTKLIAVRRGDRIDYLHPQTGDVVDSASINVSTDKKPENVAAAAAAAEGAKLKQKLNWDPQIKSLVVAAEVRAREQGLVLTDYNRAKAAMPGLLGSVAELKELGQIATSTLAGRAYDAVVRESGFGATKGGTARAKFIALINSQVLPLLRE